MNLILNSEIEELLEHFYNISGLRIGLHDEKMNIILEYPAISEHYDELIFCDRVRVHSKTFDGMCCRCDREAYRHVCETRQTYIYTCHGGFYEALVPIFMNGVILCCFMIGNVRPEEGYRSVKDILSCVPEEVTPTDELVQSHLEMPRMTLRRFRSLVYFLEICARDIYERRAIRLQGQELIDAFRRYIQEHYREPLNITQVAAELKISASHLSRIISLDLQTTFTEYLNRTRVEAAKDMLMLEDMTITEIARTLSYRNATYFMRIFKKITGMTCSEYRAQKSIE